MNFAAVLARIEQILSTGPWPSAVAGGVALAAYGSPRLTIDLDIVTHRDAQPAVIAALERTGYETLYRSSGFSNHRHFEAELGRVDLIYVDDVTSGRLFAAARTLMGPASTRIRVPSPEHLAAMKIQAIRNAPDRTLRDLADVAFLLTVEGVNRDEIKGYFEQAGLLHHWTDVIRER
ncbi:MAG: nucleotidyltransferase family protein [Cyanobacteria bacterium]|nr:nucleotidyltransferase family protein [Cyanobacteriota bacterium]